MNKQGSSLIGIRLQGLEIIFLTKRKELWSAVRSKVVMREWNEVRCAVPCDEEFEVIFFLCKDRFKIFSAYHDNNAIIT